jgi:hypothetical protein
VYANASGGSDVPADAEDEKELSKKKASLSDDEGG